jgi:hypothetical protein
VITHHSDIDLFAGSARELNAIVQSLPLSRWKRFNPATLNPLVDERRHRAAQSGAAVDWIVAVVLQAPRAAVAQRQMDDHPHDFNGRQTRLYELIDFNDSFVEAILALPEKYLPDIQAELKRQIDWFCARLKTPTFTDVQYEAITHGLSREIAVYRGAKNEGLLAEMTSRAQDAKGVDMVITDPATQRVISVDIKTQSAYYYRLKDLRHEGRITPSAAEQAEIDGFCVVRHEHDEGAVDLILLRIDPEEVGEIQDFGFLDTSRLGERLRRVIAVHGAPTEGARVAVPAK